MKIKILAAILVIGAATAGLLVYFGPNGSNEKPSATVPEIVEPTNGMVVVTIDAPALIEPYRKLTVRSSSPGEIVFRADPGAIVMAGDLLVELDPARLETQVNRALIDQEEAEINRERAHRTLDRATRDLEDMERLHAAGGASREQLENSREAVTSAEQALRLADLTVQKATIALNDAETDLENARIHAPWDGVVLSTDVDAGDTVGSSSALLVLAELERVRVLSEIDEFDVARVRPGLPVNVRVEAIAGSGAGPFNTQVELVSPAAEVVSNIAVFTVSAVLDNPGIVLRPGMSADMIVTVARDEGLVVPSRAVTTVRNQSYLEIVPRHRSAADGDDDSETVEVELGASDGIHTVILSGLEDTDRIIIPDAAAGFALPVSQSAPTTGDSNSIVPVPVPGAGTGSTGGSPGAGGGGGGGGGGR